MQLSQNMNTFNDLAKSQFFEDCVRYSVFIKLLDTLFDKHNEIIINSSTESETNQEFIKDQIAIIHGCFNVPKRVFQTQKCVRQTLKHIVEFLNQEYQFKNPIQFITRRDTVREGSNVFARNYSTLDLFDSELVFSSI